MKDKILKAIKEDRLMDFVTRNYYNMSKEELKIVLVELYYAMYQLEEELQVSMTDVLLEELEERL